MPFLIDSDVLIDIARGNREAGEYVNSLPEGWAIFQVAALELIVGSRDKRELAETEVFLSAYATVPLSGAIGEPAYKLLKATRGLMGCMSSIRSSRPPRWRRV
jgi:predicted nucleic acid-binding protein